MTYEQAIDYLYASTPAFHLVGKEAYKPGLNNTLALMEHLGNPHLKWPSVHIAGTNGKGSTSHLIAAALQCAGKKVGLYTSPHLVDFRERIRINAKMIPQEEVAQFITDQKEFLDKLHPSFFETTMGLAFWYFAKEKVDIAVIEVGLGGRLDSTNVITPKLSIITNIGFDHTEFLGHTLAAIAGEKAGIIKEGVSCVIGESDSETMPVFIGKAEQMHSTIYFADQCEYLRRCRLRDIPECQLHGIYQHKNMQTAYVALRALHIPTPSIRDGFRQVCTLTGLRGRWEVLREKPLTICDTGHNSHGIRYVAEQLGDEVKKREGEKAKLHIVFGMVDDKDVEAVMGLLPQAAHYYWTQAQTHRAIPATKLGEMAKRINGLNGECFSTVKDAIWAAQKAATDKDMIFIGGSNYVVGEALPLFSAECTMHNAQF